jgi:uncharacterized protein YprB with RNaseH-like and TPR domain
MSRILFWDIESSDLRSDWGFTICTGYKWMGEDEIHCPSVLDYPNWKDDLTDDSRLIKDVHKVLASADLLVTFYGKGFDLKWMNSKFLRHGLPVLPNHPHVDLYYIARSNLNLSRKSLDNLATYLKLGAKKYHVGGEIWQRARVGHEPSIRKVIEHCKADVTLTEKLYMKLRPLVRQHPRVDGWAPCRVCGSTKLQKRGYAMTSTKGKRVRVMCSQCGAWETRTPEHAEVNDT